MISLFDVQAGFWGTISGQADCVTLNEVVHTLDTFQIDGMLLKVEPVDMDIDFMQSNTQLYTHCAQDERLMPCPVVVPSTGKDVPTEEHQVDDAIRNGAGAVFIRLQQDHWFIAHWLSDQLFEVCQQRRMPVMCTADLLPVKTLAELAHSFPDCPFIYSHVGYRDQRILLPLLCAHRNIYLSIGNNYCVHRGLEQFVAMGCADQLLFGTGFPQSEPMSAIMYLLNADLPESVKKRIGYDNYKELTGRILK